MELAMISFLNPLFLCICMLLLSTIVFAKILIQKKHSIRKYHPAAGTNINMILNFNRLFDYLTNLCTEYNMTFRFISGFTTNMIITADPANVEYILKTKFDNYGNVYN